MNLATSTTDASIQAKEKQVSASARMKWAPMAVAICSLVLLSTAASAQNLDEVLSNVGSEYGLLYTGPLTNSLGADLNAGLFHAAKSGGGSRRR